MPVSLATTQLTADQALDRLLELPLDSELQFGIPGSSAQAVLYDALTGLASTYTSGALAAYRGAAYKALQAVPANTVLTNSAYWSLVGLTHIGEAWAGRQDKLSAGGVAMQYLFAARDLVGLQMGRIARRAVEYERAGGSKVNNKDWFDNLKAVQTDLDSQIANLIMFLSSTRQTKVGQLTTLNPQAAIVPWRDPNSPILSGDPRYPSWAFPSWWGAYSALAAATAGAW